MNALIDTPAVDPPFELTKPSDLREAYNALANEFSVFLDLEPYESNGDLSDRAYHTFQQLKLWNLNTYNGHEDLLLAAQHSKGLKHILSQLRKDIGQIASHVQELRWDQPHSTIPFLNAIQALLSSMKEDAALLMDFTVWGDPETFAAKVRDVAAGYGEDIRSESSSASLRTSRRESENVESSPHSPELLHAKDRLISESASQIRSSHIKSPLRPINARAWLPGHSIWDGNIAQANMEFERGHSPDFLVENSFISDNAGPRGMTDEALSDRIISETNTGDAENSTTLSQDLPPTETDGEEISVTSQTQQQETSWNLPHRPEAADSQFQREQQDIAWYQSPPNVTYKATQEKSVEVTLKQVEAQAGLQMFDYERLPAGPWFRVFYLGPGMAEEPICGSLKSFRFDARMGTFFEAISYCWGSYLSPSSVQVLDAEGSVTIIEIGPNLESALRRLRYRDTIRCLWVDAICINQSDPVERAHQMSLMGEIYSKASIVLVWLGDRVEIPYKEDFSPGRLFGFIKDRLLNVESFQRTIQDSQVLPEWEALICLLANPWFQRRSIIQEAVLARSATVHCEQQIIPWPDLCDVVSLLQPVSSRKALRRITSGLSKEWLDQFWDPAAQSIGAASLIKICDTASLGDGSRISTKSLSIESLVSMTGIFVSRHPRDTIYSLLSLAKDVSLGDHESTYSTKTIEHPSPNALIWSESYDSTHDTRLATSFQTMVRRINRKEYKLSYQTSYVDIFGDFVEFCIEQYGSLDIICRSWAPTPSPISLSETATGELTYQIISSKRELERSLIVSDREYFLSRPADEYTTTHVSLRDSEAGLNDLEVQSRLRSGSPSWIRNTLGAPFESIHVGGLRFMRRINADTLVGLPTDKPYRASGHTRAILMEGRIPRHIAGTRRIFAKGFILGNVDRTSCVAQGGNIPLSWLGFPPTNPESASFPADLSRTLVAGRGPDGASFPSHYVTMFKAILKDPTGLKSLEVKLEEPESALKVDYLLRVQEVIFNRRLIKLALRSRQGDQIQVQTRLGLGPAHTMPSHDAEEGDLVCILHGCSVPVILRKGVKSESSKEEDRYNQLQKLREAYHHAARAIENRYVSKRKRQKFAVAQSKISTHDPGQEYSSLSLRFPSALEDNLAPSSTTARISHFRSHLTPQEQNMLFLSMCLKWEDMIKPGRDYPFKSQRIMDRSLLDQIIVPEEFYKVVGECYIDGMMDGEALDFKRTYNIPEQIFELR